MTFYLGLASSVTANLINQLPKVAIKELSKIYYVDQKLSSLRILVITIQRKVDELGDKELTKAEWSLWVQNLIKIFSEAEDLIDTIKLAVDKHNHEMPMMEVQKSTLWRWFSFTRNQTPASGNKVRGIVLSFKKIGVPRKINGLLSEFQKSKNELDMIIECSSKNSYEPYAAQLGAHVDLTESRKKVKEVIIKDYLLNPSFRCAGVSIIGMAGSGKTTLARSIQKDDDIKGHFDYVVWASVPGKFGCSEPVIFLQDEEGQPVVDVSIESLLQRDGKTLLVLDDIWNVQHHVWRDSVFSQSHRSEVTLLITTRDPRVYKTTETHPYHIEGLSDTECKELIKKESPSYASTHDYMMGNLAKYCCGLPLVANKLGQAIESMSDDTYGVPGFSVFKDLWDLQVFRDVIFPGLKFNDPPLPREMSKCLVYMTLFPHGYKFKKDELAQLWFAEGFLPPDDQMWLTKAIDYIDALYWRSILQVSNHGQQDRMQTFEMHKFVRGFARYRAFNTCYQVEESGNLPDLTKHIRHLSICCQTIDNSILDPITEHFKRLRTFLLLHKSGTKLRQIPESFFSELHYLRVVNISNSSITCLPRSIRKLNHLRCLDASNTCLQTLNDKLCDLFGLQILRLKNCRKLLCLPARIGKLVNLIFLEVDIQRLSSTPSHIGSLINLQALEEYVVEQGNGKRISELKNMNHLRGSTKIKRLENVKDDLEARSANLIEKAGLEGLELHWTKTSPLTNSSSTAQSILTALEPNERLQELKLMCYNGASLPSWLNSCTRALTKIHLYDCPFIEDLSLFWKLPYLSSLFVDTLSKIERVDRTFFGDTANPQRFIRLESLEFRKMENLKSWEEMVHGDFPTLRHLMITDCPRFDVWPSFDSLPNIMKAKVRRGGHAQRRQNLRSLFQSM